MTKLRITQIKSRSGLDKRQIANLRSLGLRRIRHTVEVEKTPVSEGMVRKVQHVVVVEEIN
ncbi:MAG: 50S ribosomal protein L30 [Bacteroidales bacterium]|jgi:large subunit ribosomal protein L30|nr:50S ribosomal protein L30 [Bacteroidales bacterium]MDY2935179.1 50S ribosomal protein L30 [Candidatus Cryptobacteroides sp.]MCH3940956.1 50S ribosomal protein L30 [Bacteroidales bacterium]MCI2108785.1 50S ribosomal protein L30 [Bacteroidales bacterium]MCI5720298.1 50S ribosomal protein L30 [Bacteroidales bacterium]